MTSVDTLHTALADRYRIERELGRGGMATVYLARDLKHDRDVALKVLKPELAAVLGRERFLNEIRLTASLDHPHILTLIDSGENQGVLWYVLPFIRGESLRVRLNRETQLGIDEALEITRQIAGALDYAHQKGVIHRDIKPENILLHEGEAVLADFGIALAVKEAGGNRLTETGLSLGTPSYMSPEQATGERAPDARSDVYSLAAVLYELLAGEAPHTGATVAAVIAKLLTERPTPLRTVRDSVPAAVETAVAKGLAKVPADRFPSAGAFAVATRLRPTSEQVIKASRVRFVAAGLVLAALGALTVQAVRKQQPRLVTYQPVQLTTTGRAREPVLSPDGSQVAYINQSCDDGGKCRYDLVIRETASDAEQVILPDMDFGSLYRWSPNGLWLLVFGLRQNGSDRLGVVPRIGGPARYFGIDLGDFVGSGDTILTTAELVTVSGHVRLHFRATATGAIVDTLALAVPPSVQWVETFRVSPDGRWIITLLHTRGPALFALYDRTGTLRDSVSVEDAHPDFRVPRWSPRADAVFMVIGGNQGTLGGALARVPIDPARGRFGKWDTVTVSSGSNRIAGFDLAGDGRTLVFAAAQPGTYHLWSVEIDKGVARPRRKLMTSSVPMFPALTRDGNTVFFNSADATAGSSRSAWFAQPFDRGVAHQVTPYEAGFGSAQFTIGLDGRHLFTIASSTGAATLNSYRVSDGASRKLASLRGAGYQLAEGPNGGLALLNATSDTLTLMEPDGRVIRTLAIADSIGPIAYFYASSDASAFLFFGINLTRDEKGNYDFPLYRLDARDGSITLLRRLTGLEFNNFIWGDHTAVFVEMRTVADPRYALYRVPLDGSPHQRVVGMPFQDRGTCAWTGNARRASCVVSTPTSDLFLIRNFDPEARR
jgi:Tol biopolymer transport system component